MSIEALNTTTLLIYMSQAQKRDYERDKEVWNSHSIWGSGMDTGSSDVHVQWFSHWKTRADDHDVIM